MRGDVGERLRSVAVSTAAVDTFFALLIAGLLCLVTFVAGGGLSLPGATRVEMGLTLAGGAVIVATIVVPRREHSPHGQVAVIAMLALVALTALSVAWSVTPDVSWQQANLVLAYAITFIAAVRVARLWPERWPALLGGVLLAGTIVCIAALATKVFPASLAATEIYSRLQGPFQYWNATGLLAAMTVPPALWLGSRRRGHAALNALAFPTLGLALVTLLLAYSRGALLALAIGLVVYFTAIPLRLRGALVLATAAAAAGSVVAWVFTQGALTHDRVALAPRTSAGHQLGIVLLALVAILLIAGLWIGFQSARHPLSAFGRHRTGLAMLCALALVPVVAAIALTASSRGLFGSIGHDVSELTSTHISVTNDPSRLTAIASVRALYWEQAFNVWKAHPALGTGAGGYATARLRYGGGQQVTVQHAHGFIVQTMADLGLVGLAVSLVLFFAWLVAALRSARPWGLGTAGRTWRRTRGPAWARDRYTPERVGLLTMFVVVVIFGAHSFIDWTWYVPADACVALLLAGGLAGRGPSAAAAPQGAAILHPARRRRPAPAWSRAPAWSLAARAWSGFVARVEAIPLRPVAVAVVAAVALIGAWAQWQPLRSSDAYTAALLAVGRGDTAGALASAQQAVSRDPLSPDALFALSAANGTAGRPAQARALLQQAVRSQPANPLTWCELATYDEANGDPHAALADLGPDVFLEPHSPAVQQAYLVALQEINGAVSMSPPDCAAG